jgi:quercetin dioxygenase-like cupin family protein
MLRHPLIAAIALTLAAGALDAQQPAPVATDHGPAEHLMHLPAEIAWQPGPPSLPPGARFAVLEGDPSEAGVFTLRLHLPDGYHIPPHWHPGVERVTVISGTFHFGHGETADRAATQALPAGSHIAMPRESRHYAYAEGDTVIQLTSLGPWEVHYVNPADDPRTRRER